VDLVLQEVEAQVEVEMVEDLVELVHLLLDQLTLAAVVEVEVLLQQVKEQELLDQVVLEQ
jgi:hypothetical protein